METLKNNANRIVGTKQVLRAVKAGKLQRIYVANDVDTFLYQQVIRAAEAAEVPVTRVESMKELGEACGVQVAAAAAGIVKE
ncbi:MAG: ribosomal L7Ae/L30e/S12e/Gadd45 family protein [Clostridiales bacterium]|nr:ribosomal L7Ae/L30e/S12e/Gadd45 family protein [Clostridiales bacterium]